MRVQLKLVLDATPDAVWWALRSPGIQRELAHPFFSFEPISPRGLPRVWPEGPHSVRASLLWGLIPVGEQVIDISYHDRGETRIVEDSGGVVSGALAVVTGWRHRMAVTRTEGDRTLYRDRLDISAGVLTTLVWIGAWAFWQWRAFQLTRLAPGWKASAE